VRGDKRALDQLRSIKFTTDYLMHPEGSVLVEYGNTKVICTATVTNDVPKFLKSSGKGWVTAEYSMLPRATNTRTRRERQKIGGRTAEIQRLIGRSLRSIVDLSLLPERSVLIDCDVIQADGGTRTASISGGFVALAIALKKLKEAGEISEIPIRDYVAAVSMGLLEGTTHLDLEYSEDSSAEVDMNLVMTGSKEIVEVQGTAETKPFSQKQLSELVEVGWKGIESIIVLQKEAIGSLS